MDYDEVDATNNLAERQLRPAVIARKVGVRQSDGAWGQNVGNPFQPRRDLSPEGRFIPRNGLRPLPPPSTITHAKHIQAPPFAQSMGIAPRNTCWSGMEGGASSAPTPRLAG